MDHLLNNPAYNMVDPNTGEKPQAHKDFNRPYAMMKKSITRKPLESPEMI